LIDAWGATRATVVTYVFPIIGLFLGVAVLREPLTARLVAGTLLIVTGIAIVNRVPAVRSALGAPEAAARSPMGAGRLGE